MLFSQNSERNKNEQSIIFNYKLTDNEDNEDEEDIYLTPAIFIFFIDQSGSMAGNSIKVASRALLLFLQSLPVGSYYQIIGFGSSFVMHDIIPNEYTQENIDNSIKLIESLKANMGGTNIYDPLKYIYDSKKDYDNILLPKNIFLLTDGEIRNKKETLELIEKNSNDFTLYSIGIGNSFDEDLIKNAGILGKGDYSFCNNIDGLNKVIVANLTSICVPYINNFKVSSSIDEDNIYDINEIQKVMKDNKIYKFGYILKDKSDKKKMEFIVRYTKNKQDIIKKYEMEPIELPSGEELSKLIIYNYILKYRQITKEDKIKLALKYQLFLEGTSLFAEILLSGKVTEQMKYKKIVSGINDKNKSMVNKKQNRMQVDNLENMRDSMEEFNSSQEELNDFFDSYKHQEEEEDLLEQQIIELEKEIFQEKALEDSDIKKEEKALEDFLNNDIIPQKPLGLNLNYKEDIMKIIISQNFIEGFWAINDKTNCIKIKYETEFNSLKELKENNMDETVAMTIMVIYFINKDHPELLDELILILKKAKIFIKKKMGESYENIIKKINV